MYTYKCTRTNRERLAHEMQIKQYKNTHIRIRMHSPASLRLVWHSVAQHTAWHSTQHGVAQHGIALYGIAQHGIACKHCDVASDSGSHFYMLVTYVHPYMSIHAYIHTYMNTHIYNNAKLCNRSSGNARNGGQGAVIFCIQTTLMEILFFRCFFAFAVILFYYISQINQILSLASGRFHYGNSAL